MFMYIKKTGLYLYFTFLKKQLHTFILSLKTKGSSFRVLFSNTAITKLIFLLFMCFLLIFHHD